LLQDVDASLQKILVHRTTFRLQVGQLVIQEVECSYQPKKKYW